MEICSPAKTRYFSLKTVKLVRVTVSEQIRLTAAESMLIECTELLVEIISMLVFESARVFVDFTGDLYVFFSFLMQSYSQISSLNARATLDSKKFEIVEVST